MVLTRQCMTGPGWLSLLDQLHENQTWMLSNYAITLHPASRLLLNILLVSHFLTAGRHICGVRQTVWYHGHKLAQIVNEAIEEGGRKWVLRELSWDGQEKERRFKRVSVYWCTSLSSQQEFFPCFIITAHLSMHIRLWRDVKSPPDVISSTFTYNHIEEQHGFRCDGLEHVHYIV